MALEAADKIRVAHNSFSHQEPFEYEEVAAKEGDDVFHFISYIPFNDGVYELDGIQKGPIFIGNIETGKDWLQVAKTEIHKRIEEYTSSEIHFNLLAIIGDMQERLMGQLESDKVIKSVIEKRLGIPVSIEVTEEILAKYKTDIEALPSETKEITNLHETLSFKINENTKMLEYEIEKRKKWSLENQRRRHNYLPFIFELLKTLAEIGRAHV